MKNEKIAEDARIKEEKRIAEGLLSQFDEKYHDELCKHIHGLSAIELEEIIEYLLTHCADCTNKNKLLIIEKYSEILLKIRRDTLKEGIYNIDLIYTDFNKKLRHAIIDSIKGAVPLLSQFDEKYHKELWKYINKLGVEKVKDVLESHSTSSDTDSHKMQLISDALGLFLKNKEKSNEE